MSYQLTSVETLAEPVGNLPAAPEVAEILALHRSGVTPTGAYGLALGHVLAALHAEAGVAGI
jgi:hypothetical protein